MSEKPIKPLTLAEEIAEANKHLWEAVSRAGDGKHRRRDSGGDEGGAES